MKRRSAFTLAELLIVVAIIGIMVIVLLPNLLQSRKTALQVALQAHVRNVYTAFLSEQAQNPLEGAEDVIADADPCDAAGETKSGFPWTSPPPILSTCAVEVTSDGFGIVVRATDTDGEVYVAGQ